MRLVNNGCSAYRACRITGVPESTIKDRRLGNVSADTFTSGPKPLFTEQEEDLLKNHMFKMSENGYGYSRKDTLSLATYTTQFLGKLKDGKQFSENWLYRGFLKRHNDLTFSRDVL